VDDASYFRLRAGAELERAERSGHPRAAEAHAALARQYLENTPSRPADARPAPQDFPPCDHAVHDEWAVRMARVISSEHGNFATDYVLTRIETAQALGQARSVQAWQSVLERLRSLALCHGN
jgi:hypothetical protein